MEPVYDSTPPDVFTIRHLARKAELIEAYNKERPDMTYWEWVKKTQPKLVYRESSEPRA